MTTDALDLPDKGLVCGSCKLRVHVGDLACSSCGAKFRKAAAPQKTEENGGDFEREGNLSDTIDIDSASLNKSKIAAVLGDLGDYGLIKSARMGNPVGRIRLMKAAQGKGIDRKLLMQLFGR